MAKVAKAVVGGVLIVVGAVANFYVPGSGLALQKLGYGATATRDAKGRTWSTPARRLSP